MKALGAKGHLYLSAPGGYGKTIAARQWLAAARGKSAVLVVGEAENDAGLFHKRLATVLTGLASGKKPPKSTAESLTLEGLLTLIRALPKRGVRSCLFIDDFHVIKNNDILHGMALVARQLPGYITCLLAGRGPCPPLLFLTGRFAIIDQDDLLFSPAEVEWLGAEKDHYLEPGHIQTLLDITGGWAMYLAAILSDQGASGGVRWEKLPPSLSQYLKTQVWEKWSPETQALLLRLSIPRKLGPELAKRLSGRADGGSLLENLAWRENTFLAKESGDSWCFHDVFHDFLSGLAGHILGADETRRLNGIAAEWYYEQGDYYESVKHFIVNGNHAGISHCMVATTLYSGVMGAMSVINRLEFFRRHILSLPASFIAENPYLISKCAVAAYYDGDIDGYFRHVDMLYGKQDEIFTRHFNLIETYIFATTFDPRITLKDCAKRVLKQTATLPARPGKAAQTTSITQTLPFFHRSMRDFSEYHQLKEADLKMLGNSFGGIIGSDYAVMERLIIAGLRYERGELLEALYQSMAALRICGPDTHPEALFSTQALLAAVLYATGAVHEADRVMEKATANAESHEFLRANGHAFQTMHRIQKGETNAAREWLGVYQGHPDRLPFYQVCRHFATLRSYIALEDHAAAVALGRRLLALVTQYRRPLDQIETGLLLALALWQDGQKEEAARHLTQSATLACSHGFTQLFVNEGKALLPLLVAEPSPHRHCGPAPQSLPKIRLTHFFQSIKKDICQRQGLNPGAAPDPSLTARQREMLIFLESGLSYGQIATATGLTRGTVKVHVLALYKRLGVHDATAAVTQARMLGII